MKILQVLVLIFGLAITVISQTNYTTVLSGTVYDANGAVIPKTIIKATNEKGEKFETETDDEGLYVLNLPYNKYDTKTTTDFRVASYEIIVDLTDRGFEKFVLKDFKLVPSYLGKMNLDIALDTDNSNCGAGGCIQSEPVEPSNPQISDKILQKPLEELPKDQNKTKRKNKNNKQ